METHAGQTKAQDGQAETHDGQTKTHAGQTKTHDGQADTNRNNQPHIGTQGDKQRQVETIRNK